MHVVDTDKRQQIQSERRVVLARDKEKLYHHEESQAVEQVAQRSCAISLHPLRVALNRLPQSQMTLL